MANASNIGKSAYAYIGGKAVVHLKDWDYSLTNGVIQLDPDIGSTRVASVTGFLRDSGTINYNFSSDDFANIFDAMLAGAAVALYLYPEKGSAKIYLYGNAFLTDLGHTNPLLASITGKVGFVNSDTTGFNRQTTA